jgi:hypothetical protein
MIKAVAYLRVSRRKQIDGSGFDRQPEKTCNFHIDPDRIESVINSLDRSGLSGDNGTIL